MMLELNNSSVNSCPRFLDDCYFIEPPDSYLRKACCDAFKIEPYGVRVYAERFHEHLAPMTLFFREETGWRVKVYWGYAFGSYDYE